LQVFKEPLEQPYKLPRSQPPEEPLLSIAEIGLIFSKIGPILEVFSSLDDYASPNEHHLKIQKKNNLFAQLPTFSRFLCLQLCF
jgi:hypothetical protein